MPTTEKADDLDMFRHSMRQFAEREVAPRSDEWRRAGIIDRELWRKAGKAGLLCASVPTQYGGGGATWWHEVVIIEELARIGFPDFGIPLLNAVCVPYIVHYGTEEQKARWIPRLASGELIVAIAMTEPSGGSDLQAMRTHARLDGDHYIVNGQKTFITHGHVANLIIVALRTSREASGRANNFSLLVVETDDAPGFRRGRRLEKLGLKGQDTAELFFEDMRVPAENLLGGREGHGFYQLMEQLPKERLNIAIQALALTEAALDETVRYVKQRQAFGKRLIDFQNTRMVLAEAKTATTIGRSFIEACIEKLAVGKLDANTAAMAKWWMTERQCEIIDHCVQLHGGYGYMAEYPVARMWADGRIQKIWGGTNEIMKDLIARGL